MDIIAWTGGTAPKKLLECSEDEQVLRSFIFKENMKIVFHFWGDYRGLNESCWQMARIQYNRAKYDAHATFRNR